MARPPGEEYAGPHPLAFVQPFLQLRRSVTEAGATAHGSYAGETRENALHFLVRAAVLFRRLARGVGFLRRGRFPPLSRSVAKNEKGPGVSAGASVIPEGT